MPTAARIAAATTMRQYSSGKSTHSFTTSGTMSRAASATTSEIVTIATVCVNGVT
ncbi:hypothetical protein [Microbacterium sp. Marseille-Q6648]|uniref:hypothetical protein n=1 Tax=Microbacterium sp. Marseille-Q6648 TaxID=2937991 RepID=UPI00203B6315|nr:hypothetical protein [Microbacterium sp. Marseille-Q6648]